MTSISTLGFVGVGVGVMGEPMCRNLKQKCRQQVLATDLRPEPLERLASYGVEPAHSVAAIAQQAELIFLSLPGGPELEAVCREPDGLLAVGRDGQTIVDLSTAPVGLTRALAAEFEARGMHYADAPVARTREAAEKGTLSVMVGAEAELFQRIEAYLRTFATEVTHCGAVGAGQLVKLMNNMVLLQTVIALAEALSVARRAGVDGTVLFETLSKGSADSFAVRNHGMKALLPGEFPERAFPVTYMVKDLSYARALAKASGLSLRGAGLAATLLQETIDLGFGESYFPAVLHAIDRAESEKWDADYSYCVTNARFELAVSVFFADSTDIAASSVPGLCRSFDRSWRWSRADGAGSVPGAPRGLEHWDRAGSSTTGR